MGVRAGYMRDDDLGVEVVVLSDEESQDSIEIQRALKFDESDRADGTDRYCVVRGAAATFYGGVTAWRTTDSSVVFEFSPEAAAALDLPSSVTIDVDEADLKAVLGPLERLLG